MRTFPATLQVHVTVRASPALRALALALAVLQLALARALATGTLGAFHFPLAFVLAHLLSAAALGWQAVRPRKACPIDVSGPGSLRATVQRDGCASLEAVQLLSGSTLWPWLLALRVRASDGAVRHVLIAPDSVARGQFRPLAVALRTLAARGVPPASPQ